MTSIENQRLQQARADKIPWKKWGPYLSERQWGTVREDYSDDGNAWDYLTHEQSGSRAYRWGEDGLGGISDRHQLLCFALALWNGKDPILKERLFGLTNSQGNHGEDVKEYYFYLDSTPTHSWMKYLYKYPQAVFPYEDLVTTNQQRGPQGFEYELLDTGVFDEDRYFDVFVEYAKSSPEDICIKITACNRGPEAAPLHLLPTLWFRHTWSWAGNESVPVMEKIDGGANGTIHAYYPDSAFADELGDYYLYCEGNVPLLFTDNETNNEVIFNSPNDTDYVKDGINNYVVNGQQDAVNSQQKGTKVAPHYQLTLQPGESQAIRLRLTKTAPAEMGNPFADFEQIYQSRLQDADEFYAEITPAKMKRDSDRCNVMRQALAGMLWTKQYFYYDVELWLEEHGLTSWMTARERSRVRNSEWFHMNTDDIISMPDKWEYPWFAAWDLAFHIFPLQMVDPDFASQQLALMLHNDYLHPNGQLPAYEWDFGDVNPPVHAWATIQNYFFEKIRNNGQGNLDFLEYTFGKLLLYFSWWVNRKDPGGNNVFQGGFLGLDNIGVFDRSKPLPTGGHLEQADGTSWMAFFSLQMLRISIELALDKPLYETYVDKFFSHNLSIAGAMDRMGEHENELWDEEDGFFYDLLYLPDGTATRLKVRSMVGLLPLMAVCVFPEQILEKFPHLGERLEKLLARHPELTANIHSPSKAGMHNRRMVSIVNEQKLRLILTRMLDENEFLGLHGIRSLSLYHKDNPYVFYWGGQEFRVDYLPGESDSGMFGGNSNWRGPVWMPVNMLLITSLLNYYSYYGDKFTIECPTGSGNLMTLLEVAEFISERLARIFLKDEEGSRPVYGGTEKFQHDPNWRDLILFSEYFHGDNGAGIGASHQTGWTGCIAVLLQFLASVTPEDFDKEMLLAGGFSLAHIQRPSSSKISVKA